MKKLLKILGVIIGLAVLVILGFMAYIGISGIPKYEPGKLEMKVEATPERIARGQKIASVMCIECHANENGILTGKLLIDVPLEFGAIYSRNITHDPEIGIGSWTDGELYYLLRTGIRKDGQYIPPYMVKYPLASDEDVKSIIAWLRSDAHGVQASQEEAPPAEPSFLTKFLTHVAFKPFALPTQEIKMPDTSDKVAFGRYLSTALFQCYPCHSADFKTMNELEPEKSVGYFGGGNPLLNKERKVIHSANITPDESGIGAYSEEEFLTVLKTGKKRDGSQVRYPMIPYAVLTDEEIRAIYAYLQTVPKIKNDIKALAAANLE
ncbi:MAG: cytochrome c [Bacteroidia bacterium]|jgi:mono/diheme cytochrome c family protein